MAISRPKSSKATTLFRDLKYPEEVKEPESFEVMLLSAGNTAQLLDMAYKFDIRHIAIGIWEEGYHHLKFMRYVGDYAFTRRFDDTQGHIAWSIAKQTRVCVPGSNPGTILLQANPFQKGIYQFRNGEWKRETPA